MGTKKNRIHKESKESELKDEDKERRFSHRLRKEEFGNDRVRMRATRRWDYIGMAIWVGGTDNRQKVVCFRDKEEPNGTDEGWKMWDFEVELLEIGQGSRVWRLRRLREESGSLKY
jgi:hypothetical protein